MPIYIDSEHLMEKVSRMIDYCYKNKDKKFNALSVLFQVGDAIMDCPTADVVEVVRCRDCSHRNPCCHKCLRDNLWHDDEDFCSFGERKEEK